jgi:hypothetical protein
MLRESDSTTSRWRFLHEHKYRILITDVKYRFCG